MPRRRTAACGAVAALLLAGLAAEVIRLGGPADTIMELIPLIPTERMAATADAFIELATCRVLPFLRQIGVLAPALDCVGGGARPLWVAVVPSKGGIVLVSRIIFDLSTRCGICFGMSLKRHKAAGDRWNMFWPPLEIATPSYDSDVMMAPTLMRRWPHYARTQAAAEDVKCVVVTRDPLTRLRSHHTYALSGGDYDLRWLGEEMRGRPAAEGLATMWSAVGRESMNLSHGYLLDAIAEGCAQIPFEHFKADFDRTVMRIFDVWGVRPGAREELLEIASHHDMGRWTSAKVKESSHVSVSKFSAEYMRALGDAVGGHDEIMRTVRRQRAELRYDAETGRPPPL